MKTIKFILLLGMASFFACNKTETGVTASDSGSPPPSGGVGTGGSMARFAIVENTLYTVTVTDLNVFDISNTANPAFKGSIPLGVNIETIFPRDENTLFIGSTDGVHIYDIKQKQNPVKLSVYRHVVACDPVVANNTTAYATLRSIATNRNCNRGVNQLMAINITKLSSPSLIRNYPLTGPKGLGLWNNDLFVCDEGSLIRYNAANPANLVVKNTFNLDAYDVIPYGNTLICVGNFGIRQYGIYNDSLEFLSNIAVNAR